MIFKNKLLMILLITTFSIPLSVFAYSDKVIVGGDNVGIEVNSSGVLVVGYYSINGKTPVKEAGL